MNNLTMIGVVHAALPAVTYLGGISSQFTISGPGISTATYTPSSLPGTYTPTTYTFNLGPVGNTSRLPTRVSPSQGCSTLPGSI